MNVQRWTVNISNDESVWFTPKTPALEDDDVVVLASEYDAMVAKGADTILALGRQLLEAHNRSLKLEGALRIIASYTGHDSAAWAAKEIAKGALEEQS